jgi:branched-chain amino acid aminotransferase
MLDTRGFVAETNATHVFIVREDAVATPRVLACPEGITRATVLEICATNGILCEERDVSPEDVSRADEMFCTGTMGELAAVIKVDGQIIGDGEVGPMTRRLSGLFAERTASEGVEVV